jgi:uncharacterized NAD-dependent epimerase/dehydratase family protein
VRAIALNTALLEAEPAAAATQAVVDATGLAVVDPVRQGGEALLAAVLAGAGAALPDTAL